MLVIAEHRAGVLHPATLELISAGRDLAPVVVAVAGPVADGVLDALDVAGVAEIVCVQGSGEELDPDDYRALLFELVRERQPTVTLVASTPHSFAYAAAAAAAAGLGFASDVQALRLEGESIVATRSFYGGKVIAELDFPNRTGVLLVLRRAVWPPAPATADRAPRVALGGAGRQSRVQRIGFESTARDGVDITKADLILAVGRGIGERENLDLFEALASKVGATLAVSRPLVDAGWVSADRQVGQSGKTVKPSIYLAFGISGASQHLAGMRASGMVIAVNTDPNAAIFGAADFGGVFDAVMFAQELEKLFAP